MVAETLKPPEENFITRLDDLLVNKQSQEALELIENTENEQNVIDNCSELINTIVKYLTDQNLAQNFELHNACEKILIKIATLGDESDAVFGLLEIIDSTETDNTVVSVLKVRKCILSSKFSFDMY